METVTRNVDDLALPERAALEHLLGSPLQADQRVVIIAYKAAETGQAVRDAARKRVEAMLQRAAGHAQAQGIAAEEADQAIAEAMEAIRPRVNS